MYRVEEVDNRGDEVRETDVDDIDPPTVRRTSAAQRNRSLKKNIFGFLPKVGSSGHRFGCCQLPTCVNVIAVIELSVLFVNISIACANPNSPALVAVGVLPLVVGVAVIGVLIYGVAKERPLFLLPHIIWHALVCCGLIAASVMAVLQAAAVGTRKKLYENLSKSGLILIDDLPVSIVITIMSMVALLLNIYFFIVVLRCFLLFKHKKPAETASAAENITADTDGPHAGTPFLPVSV